MPSRKGPPEEVAAILSDLSSALDTIDPISKMKVGDCKYGVYAFYDYDNEPIYVGQTVEQLRVRIRRHLSNQRTDAVAMSVLDPFEVADIEMWPYWELHRAYERASDLKDADELREIRKLAKQQLGSAEYTLFQEVLGRSKFSAVLNEVSPKQAPLTDLPPSVRLRIVPSDVYHRRKHPDIRIAQRAATIARLADVIGRRQVQPGLRATLITQARRLLYLAEQRLDEIK